MNVYLYACTHIEQHTLCNRNLHSIGIAQLGDWWAHTRCVRERQVIAIRKINQIETHTHAHTQLNRNKKVEIKMWCVCARKTHKNICMQHWPLLRFLYFNFKTNNRWKRSKAEKEKLILCGWIDTHGKERKRDVIERKCIFGFLGKCFCFTRNNVILFRILLQVRIFWVFLRRAKWPFWLFAFCLREPHAVRCWQVRYLCLKLQVRY